MSSKLFYSSILSVALMASVPFVAKAQTDAGLQTVSKGEMLTAADGRKVGAVSRVFDNGSAAVIVNRKLVVVPADTLTREDERLKTSLSYREIMKLR